MQKNKYENTELYKRLISDKNIYLSIFSVDSYIFNKELLSVADNKRLENLKDKFNETYITQTIKEVRRCIDKLVLDAQYFVNAKVFLKPKKLEGNKVIFRPLHTSDIVSQIALVSLLNMFIYELNNGYEKLTLSNLSRLIPSNFYGNRVSVNPDVLFKPWKKQYKLYTQKANELFRNYYLTNEYKYEVDLDLENFFPSIHPQVIYNLILSLLPITINEIEIELYKIILIKLIICRIINLDSRTMKEYYGNEVENNTCNFSLGIAQGLPQSYFLGNICMIEISKIFEKQFHGNSLYYVDDSVIFTNDINDDEDFNKKLAEINTDIERLCKKYIDNNDDVFFRMYNEELITFLRNQHFIIKVHDHNKKSTYTEIKQASEGEIHLRSLSREVSQIGFDLYTTYSDEEDDNLNIKMGTLIDAICHEQKILDEKENQSTESVNRNDNLDTYKTKLNRYYKFFKYRKLKMDMLKNDKDISINDKSIIIPLDDPDFLDKFINIYKNDIWSAYISLCIRRDIQKKDIEKLKKYITSVNRKIFGYKNQTSSYIYKSFNYFFDIDYNFEAVDKYQTLKKFARKKFGNYALAHCDITYDIINNTIQKYHWNDLLKESGMFTNSFLEMICIVDNSTFELKRNVLNAMYSQLFNVELNDNLVLSRKTKRSITYGELRLLVFLRNRWFSEKDYKEYKVNLLDESNISKIDYSILEVLDAFGIFVKYPILVDNLILVHQYTCDVWKNGSKYLYFYTLHNQEHAVDLIKNIIKIIKAIDYFQISRNDFYILFITCYLHDISMVKIPSMDIFLHENNDADKISMEYLDATRGKSIDDDISVRNLLITFYKEIDGFFENEVRSRHARESAYEIRSRKDLGFLDDCLRDIIAEIALAHGQRVEDVYNIKSDAKDRLVSLKFDKILLRIADLLDMSSYRISKPILNHNIEQMSSVSAFHWISHLLTKGYTIETQYTIPDSDDSVLAPKRIEEKIILHVNVAISQLSKVENSNGCEFGKIDTSSISSEGFRIKCGINCDGNACNFLCKWFVKKNQYLLMEFTALKAYLNRTSGNFYKTDIEIMIHIIDKTKLDAQQFEILKENIIQ